MYCSYSLSNHCALVSFLAVAAAQLLFISNVWSLNLTNTYLHHKCLVSQGKYKPGSEYEENLEAQIRRTATTNFRFGTEQVTTGEGPNSVTLMYQCRGDSYWSKCRSCYNAAIWGIRRRCPRNKGAIIWYDQCLLEITEISVIDAGIKIHYENNFSMHNKNKVSGDANLFNKETMAFLEKLALKASSKENMDDGKLALYAAGEKRLGTKKLYAMVQCMRDDIFTPEMCKECLGTIIRGFPKCCDGKQGGRVLGTSCNFRYELYPFLRTNDSTT